MSSQTEIIVHWSESRNKQITKQHREHNRQYERSKK